LIEVEYGPAEDEVSRDDPVTLYTLLVVAAVDEFDHPPDP
jgi:hypothetical protein